MTGEASWLWEVIHAKLKMVRAKIHEPSVTIWRALQREVFEMKTRAKRVIAVIVSMKKLRPALLDQKVSSERPTKSDRKNMTVQRIVGIIF